MGLVFISSEKNAVMSAVTQAPRRTALVVGFHHGVACGSRGTLPTSPAARARARASFQIACLRALAHAVPSFRNAFPHAFSSDLKAETSSPCPDSPS